MILFLYYKIQTMEEFIMGLLGRKKETCCLCQQNEGVKKIHNGLICNDCLGKCGCFIDRFTMRSKTSDQISEIITLNERNTELASKYSSTNHVEKYFDIDENNKIWGVPCFSPHIFFTYEDIISFELLENGNAVTKGGLGGAVVGGALLGGLGAVVGGSVGKKKTKQEITEYRIKIVTRNPVCPDVYINLLTAGKVMSNSFLYKAYAGTAQRILSLLTIITDSVSSTQVPSRQIPLSIPDEIAKYKKLLDDGVITQEEFSRKKDELLNL